MTVLTAIGSRDTSHEIERPAALSSGPLLAVTTLTGVTWCDWGSPRRVVESLERLGIRPPWLDRLTEPVGAGSEK